LRAPSCGVGGRPAAAHRVGQGRPRRRPGDVRPRVRRDGDGGAGVSVEKWYFGEDPLPEVVELAGVLRDLTSTVLSLERAAPELGELTQALRDAQHRLAAFAPRDRSPRIGAHPTPDQRV